MLEALALVTTRMNTDIGISHFVIWNSLSYYNGFHRTQINELGAAVKTRGIILTIPETL
jgi:hypothetical protein